MLVLICLYICKDMTVDEKHDNDIQLVAAAIEGDMSAFESIVKKYEGMIAGIIISMVGNRDDADDIGQETFIRFFKSMKKFRGESKLGTYLARTAINLSLNEIKRSKRRVMSSVDNEGDYILGGHSDEQQRDNEDVVNNALGLLDAKFRSIIVLRHIQGFSTKETADILGLPLGTVLSRLSRGQDKLKEIITKNNIL